MAGRRSNNRGSVKSNTSLQIYVPMAVVFLVLVMCLYTFGIDFGFVSFGGTPNVNVYYGAAILCVIASYVTDIMYIKSVHTFYKKKKTALMYIPFFNTLSLFSKKLKYVAFGLTIISLAIALPAYTPLGQFLPVSYLLFTAELSVLGIIAAIGAYSLIRGWQCMQIKSKIDNYYKKKINNQYGSGGKIPMLTYLLYYLPLIRSIVLFTDINFINNVYKEAVDMSRKEERR